MQSGGSRRHLNDGKSMFHAEVPSNNIGRDLEEVWTVVEPTTILGVTETTCPPDVTDPEYLCYIIVMEVELDGIEADSTVVDEFDTILSETVINQEFEEALHEVVIEETANDPVEPITFVLSAIAVTDAPTTSPSSSPSSIPSITPTNVPSNVPTNAPTDAPTNVPTDAPTNVPTISPTSSHAPTQFVAKGDPHFRTWTGEMFDFHGVCDLVLLSNPDFRNGVGLTIHIRTKKTFQWSYIGSAAIKIGSDTFETRGGKEDFSFWVNKEQGTPQSLVGKNALSIAGYPISFTQMSSKSRKFLIDLDDGVQLEIKTWNAYISVNVKGGNEQDFGNSHGLMGSYPNSIRLARDNKTVIDDVNTFGQEWQVLTTEEMLFHDIDGPQAPQMCQIPSTEEMRRRLAESLVSNEKAKSVCSNVPKEDFEMCVFDVLATNDLDSVEAYL